MTTSDRRQLEAVAKVVADLLADHRGVEAMVRNMRDSQAGVRSPNLQPHRGDRYEDVEFPEGTVRVRVPTNDPTGEAAAGRGDEATASLARRLTVQKRLYDAAMEYAALRDEWAPVEGAQRPVGGPGDDWCRSCHRDNQHCEPVSDRYHGLCRWCGDYKGAEGGLPPLPILRARHRGERITQAMVKQYTRKAS